MKLISPADVAQSAFEFKFLFRSATASTVSTTFVDALAGGFITPPSDGDYEIILSGEFMASNSNTTLEIGIGLNSTTTAVSDYERGLDPASANDETTFYTDTVIEDLTITDQVHGVFRRSAGSGQARLGRRRLKIQKVIKA